MYVYINILNPLQPLDPTALGTLKRDGLVARRPFAPAMRRNMAQLSWAVTLYNLNGFRYPCIS